MKICKGCEKEFDPVSDLRIYCNDCRDTPMYRVITSDCRTRYDRVRRSAKARGIEFDLHYSEFSEYYGASCVYCGDLTGTVNLDRIDSNYGYKAGNIVPCCPDCNRMKGSLTVDEFYMKIAKIYSGVNGG